jgi:hypothetical protein
MNDPAQWQKNNENYLASALKWLRLRLSQQANRWPAPVSVPSSVPSKGWWIFKSKSKSTSTDEQYPLKERKCTDRDIKEALAEMNACEKKEPPPALIILAQRFGLSYFERQILMLCAAMELDTRIASLCARAQDNPARPYPTFALAMALLEEPAWDALSPGRPLRYFRLIEINQPGAEPLTTSALRADERIVSYIKGMNMMDDRLSPLLSPVEQTEVKLPMTQEAVVDSVLLDLKNSSRNSQLPVVQFNGPDVISKQLIAHKIASALGLVAYRLPAESLPIHAAELESFIRLWGRETILLPVALYLDAHEVERTASVESGMQHITAIKHFLSRNSSVCFLSTREVWSDIGDHVNSYDVTYSAPGEQLEAWKIALNATSSENAAQLAGQFNLNVATINHLAKAVSAESAKDEDPFQRLWNLCLRTTRPRLDLLAQRLDCKATWNDIVLPEEAINLLHRIALQVGRRSKVYDDWGFRAKMNRGLGISALFTGESGTGKTMAAEVLANDLHLDLYRIDLSAVVSKYIGETEKNLRRLFDAAEDGGAILFFDEADALFGKRSEVKDSHDRYANIEINYLLQRMEAYRGLAILATNMKAALDTAFMRRLRFIVNFPFPGIAERKAIWQKVFPVQMPTTNLDWDRLARFSLTGGTIHSIALNAAFMAANEQPSEVTMSLLFAAARAEFRKLERPINETDFTVLPIGAGSV